MMNRYIRAIEEAINEAQRIIDEMHWEGTVDHTTHALEQRVNQLQAQQEEGQTYDILF